MGWWHPLHSSLTTSLWSGAEKTQHWFRVTFQFSTFHSLHKSCHILALAKYAFLRNNPLFESIYWNFTCCCRKFSKIVPRDTKITCTAVRLQRQLKAVLTSSFVVRLEATRYVWKPERPKMDQTEKKHITSSTAVKGWVKENISSMGEDEINKTCSLRAATNGYCGQFSQSL